MGNHSDPAGAGPAGAGPAGAGPVADGQVSYPHGPQFGPGFGVGHCGAGPAGPAGPDGPISPYGIGGWVFMID